MREFGRQPHPSSVSSAPGNRSVSLQSWEVVAPGLGILAVFLEVVSASRGADSWLFEPLQESGQGDYAPQHLNGILYCAGTSESLLITPLSNFT